MIPHNLYGMWEPCNCQWLMVPIPYMECRNLVTVNDCYGPPNLILNAGTLYLSMTVMVPHTLIWMVGNLITINDLWSPITLYGMWGPCNCQWLFWFCMLYEMREPCVCQWLLWSHTLFGMQEPCICQWLLWSPKPLYGMWEPCNCQWLLWFPKPYIECGNLVTVNDLWSPIPYMEW